MNDLIQRRLTVCLQQMLPLWLLVGSSALNCQTLVSADEATPPAAASAAVPGQAASATNPGPTVPAPSTPPSMTVKRCADFSITGTGEAAAWQSTDWVTLQPRPKHQHNYASRFKLLYSSSGIYVLFHGSDGRLTATLTEDFADLWNEDVFECFFWPDTTHPVYFEYEISPLGYELPILVPKLNGRFLGWRPWHYEGPRKTQKRVTVRGGPQTSLATISDWTAEIFIPWELLKPLSNVPPQPGTRWRANFYRVDYDDNQVSGWDWARVGPSFHDIDNFGTLHFE